MYAENSSMAEWRMVLMRKIFRPGTLGFHEIVDRTCLIAELFSYEIGSHPSGKITPKIRRRIKRIEQELFDLYQDLSIIHARVK